MGESLVSGRYRVTWRGGQWVVRSPDGRTVKQFGPKNVDNATANVWADRANDKLRAMEQR